MHEVREFWHKYGGIVLVLVGFGIGWALSHFGFFAGL